MSSDPSPPNILIHYFTVLARHRALVMSIVFVTALITAIYSLVMDKTFQSRVVIMPPNSSSSPLMGMLGSLPMAGMLGDLSGMGASGDGTYFVTILNSRALRTELIDTFGLREHYKMEQREIEDVLKKLDKKAGAAFDMETGMISLTVQDRDPELAWRMADWMVGRLEEFHNELQTRKARSSRMFIEHEAQRVRQELDSLESSMVAFQRDERVVEPEQQARAILEEYSALKSREALKELELRIARQNLGSTHPRIQQLEKELEGIRLLRQESYESGDSELFVAISQLPDVSMEYMRRTRDLEIANQKLLFLLPQLEQAKIEEVNTMPVLQVLDPPVIAEKRIKPKRTLMVLASAVIAFAIASVLVLFLHRLEEDEAFAGQLNHLWRTLRHGDRP